MGEGYVMKCTKCGKEHHMFLGIGFLFPQEFQQVQKEAKAGRSRSDKSLSCRASLQ